MSLSCKKEPIPEPDYSCNDGTCCGSIQAGRFKFIQSIENVPADYWSTGGGFDFKPNTTVWPYVELCGLSAEKVKNIKPTSTFGTKVPSPYKYRVWGKIFQEMEARVIIDMPIYKVNVEKVEEIK